MGLQKHTREMTRRCVSIGWFDALFFCKIVARWAYKNTCVRCDVLVFPGVWDAKTTLCLLNEDFGRLKMIQNIAECYKLVTIVRPPNEDFGKIMPPKRRFWKDEQKMKCGFSNGQFNGS